MHFISEPAKYKNKPLQCFKCFKFGHLAKYCKSANQICSRCGETNHKYDNCQNKNKTPICSNCEGDHVATSMDCPKYKEFQRKIPKTIDQYSTSSKGPSASLVNNNWNDPKEYPTLKPIMESEHISTITEQIITIVEQATQRIFDSLNKKFQILANKLGYDIELEAQEQLVNDKRINANTSVSTEQVITQDESKETNKNQFETPVNGSKRKYISPSNPIQKSKTMNTNQQ